MTSGKNVQVTDANSLQLGNVAASGTLTVATSGAITQAAGTALTVTGAILVHERNGRDGGHPGQRDERADGRGDALDERDGRDGERYG